MTMKIKGSFDRPRKSLIFDLIRFSQRRIAADCQDLGLINPPFNVRSPPPAPPPPLRLSEAKSSRIGDISYMGNGICICHGLYLYECQNCTSIVYHFRIFICRCILVYFKKYIFVFFIFLFSLKYICIFIFLFWICMNMKDGWA